jgi:hypothetical protein
MTTPVPLPLPGDDTWYDWASYIQDVAARVEALAEVAFTGQFSALVGVPDLEEHIVWDGVGTPPNRPATARRVIWYVPASNPPTPNGTTNGGAYADAPGDVVWMYGTAA